MSLSIANAVPGPIGQVKNRLPQSEKAWKWPRGLRSVAVTQRNSDVTFDLENVSLLFHATYFET